LCDPGGFTVGHRQGDRVLPDVEDDRRPGHDGRLTGTRSCDVDELLGGGDDIDHVARTDRGSVVGQDDGDARVPGRKSGGQGARGRGCDVVVDEDLADGHRADGPPPCLDPLDGPAGYGSRRQFGGPDRGRVERISRVQVPCRDQHGPPRSPVVPELLAAEPLAVGQEPGRDRQDERERAGSKRPPAGPVEPAAVEVGQGVRPASRRAGTGRPTLRP
jgi:hypothetical protein